MRSLIADRREFAGGLSLLVLGTGFLIGSLRYELGSALDMGPGYFPTALSLLLIALAVAMIARSLKGPLDETVSDPCDWRGVLTVVAAVALFGILIRGAGLYVALPASILLSSSASRPRRPLLAIGLALGMTVACDAVFRHALGVPISPIGPWLIP
jgi:putative tricarboxylic transport membrane protein